jgi:uncharacterized protein with PIN domain
MDDKRFIADAMLGKLVKWLRVLGVDVLYDPRASDDQVVRLAEQEERILLTRDRRLAGRRGTHRRLLIDSDYYHEQVRQVVHRFGLEPAMHVFTRCLRCNTPLCTVARERVAAKVPPYVAATQTAFKRCATCDRIYWGGTHRDNMLRQLQAILGET